MNARTTLVINNKPHDLFHEIGDHEDQNHDHEKAGLLSIGTDSSITDNAALSMPMVRPAAKSSYRHPLWGRPAQR